MRKSDRGRETFRETLDRLEQPNAQALMRRARAANRLAKRVGYSGRRNAYAAKVLALEALALRFPQKVTVTVDPLAPLFVVVSVADTRFGLHAPAARFGCGGLAVRTAHSLTCR